MRDEPGFVRDFEGYKRFVSESRKWVIQRMKVHEQS